MNIKQILRNHVLTPRLLMHEHRTGELTTIRTSLNIVQMLGRDVPNTVNLYDSAHNALIDISKRSDLNSASLTLDDVPSMFHALNERPVVYGFFFRGSSH